MLSEFWEFCIENQIFRDMAMCLLAIFTYSNLKKIIEHYTKKKGN